MKSTQPVSCSPERPIYIVTGPKTTRKIRPGIYLLKAEPRPTPETLRQGSGQVEELPMETRSPTRVEGYSMPHKPSAIEGLHGLVKNKARKLRESRLQPKLNVTCTTLESPTEVPTDAPSTPKFNPELTTDLSDATGPLVAFGSEPDMRIEDEFTFSKELPDAFLPRLNSGRMKPPARSLSSAKLHSNSIRSWAERRHLPPGGQSFLKQLPAIRRTQELLATAIPKTGGRASLTSGCVYSETISVVSKHGTKLELEEVAGNTQSTVRHQRKSIQVSDAGLHAELMRRVQQTGERTGRNIGLGSGAISYSELCTVKRRNIKEVQSEPKSIGRGKRSPI